MEINPVRTINSQFICHKCNAHFKKIYNPEDQSTIKCINCGSDFVEIITNHTANLTEENNDGKEEAKMEDIPLARETSFERIAAPFLLNNFSQNPFIFQPNGQNNVNQNPGIPIVQEMMIRGPNGIQVIRTVMRSNIQGPQMPNNISTNNAPNNPGSQPPLNRNPSLDRQDSTNASPQSFRIHTHNPVGFNPPRTDSIFSFGSGIFGNINHEEAKTSPQDQNRQNPEIRTRRRESNRNILNNEFPNLNINSIFSSFGRFGFPFVNTFDEDDFHSNFFSNFRSFNSIFDFIGPILASNQEPSTPPVSKSYLERIPVLNMDEKYCKKNDKGENEFPVCSICCTNFALGDKTMLIPCGHLFHPECIKPWFNEHNSCPVCRFELPTDNPSYDQSRQAQRNTNRTNVNNP